MEQKCSICNGNRKITRIVAICTRCESEIDLYTGLLNTPEKFKEIYDSQRDIICTTCGNIYTGTLNDLNFKSPFDYEERATLCVCSKDYFKNVIGPEQKLIQGHFPEEFWKREFDWFIGADDSFVKENRKVLTEIKAFRENPSVFTDIYNVFWLAGKASSGITTLAVEMAKKLMQEKSAYFITMHNLLERTKDFQDDYMEELLKFDVIVLDNAFSEGRFFLKEGFVAAKYYNFFREMMYHNKILICTSNSNLSAITNKDYLPIVELLNLNAYSFEIKGNLYNTIRAIKEAAFNSNKQGSNK